VCEAVGGIGKLLRQEGLYSSHLAKWRRELEADEQATLAPKRRGPKIDVAKAEVRRVAVHERESSRLRQKLTHAEHIIAAQKNCATCWACRRARKRRVDRERRAGAAGRDRRRVREPGSRVHPAYTKPELLAQRPRELWSWDITKLKGPAKWTCFHLYVILDVFSRYVVGWMLAPRESAALAHELIAATCDNEAIVPGQLTLHADRGTSMRLKPVALLLADLSVTKSHSRPPTAAGINWPRPGAEAGRWLDEHDPNREA